MRQQLIALFSILLVFAAVSGSVCHLVLSPGRRSILSVSDEITTSLVATLNGTINFVDLKSEKVLWSFATGAAIYSSHHNASGPGALYYIECGDDWMLYAHTQVGTRKLDGTVRGIVSTTPHIMEGVGVMNGAMKTVVFLLDANTGRLIHMYGANESEQSGSINLKTDEPLLHITRTDYFLWFASKAYTWNMTVSEIGAVFLCQDIENSISGALVGNMPLPCQSKAVVARLRSDNVSDYFSRPNRQEALELPEYGIRSLAESDAEPTKLKIFDAEPTKLKIFDAEPTKSKISGQDVKISSRGVFSVISFVLVVVVILIYFGAPLRRGSVNNLSAKNVSSKRKKNRKSGKNGGSVEKKDKKSLSELEDGYSLIESDKLFMNFNQPRDGCKDGHTIGKLFVTNKEIAKGSNGTIVLEGIYEGRPVAVKRLVRAHHDVAFKEIQNLIASDRHSNIVRWYGVEYDQNFVYLSLERCTCSLNDIVQLYSDHSEKTEYTGAQASKAMIEYKVRLDSMKDILQDIELWKANGYPSPMLLKLMRDVVSGLAHLHELGIIHRDLKPQNVLIIKGKSLTAKLSDMGISKRLVGDMSSLGHHATGHGSSGWQAPEQLLHGRQTRAVDMFSLGCVLFYCITGGRHPFGDHLERDINITKNLVDLFLVEHIPEAVDLFSCLLDPKSELRPKALDVLHHPFFWTSEMRLSFLHDTSDRVELEDRVVNSDILKTLESVAPVALGGKWNEKMEPAFLADIGQYRRYKFESVRDLLRVMRNKLNHYRELPQHIKELVGAVPEGFDDYFGSRFPKLLIEVYKVMYKFSKDEEWFRKYSSSDKV